MRFRLLVIRSKSDSVVPFATPRALSSARIGFSTPAKDRSSPTREGAVLAASATWGARTLSVIARRGYFEPLTCRHWATVIGTLPRRLGSGPPVRLLPLAVTDRKAVVSGKSVSVRLDSGGC